MRQPSRRDTLFFARDGVRGLRSLLTLALACALFVAAVFSTVTGA